MQKITAVLYTSMLNHFVPTSCVSLQIEEFFAYSEETVTSLNIKRGILGFLQIQTHTGSRMEVRPV